MNTGAVAGVSTIHHDPDNNQEHPVVIVDRKKKEVIYTGLYYYLAHFSRFVRPGAVRVAVSGSMDGVRCLAFRAQDGGIVAQVLSSRQVSTKVSLEWRKRVLRVELPALSISTFLWKAEI
jgi:glucosylceramidase